MPNYRRAKVAGATYFFTVNLAQRDRSLLMEHIDALRAAFSGIKSALPFRTDAIVVLPDHLHAIWTLPVDDADFSTRWQRIKAAFSHSLETSERRSASRTSKGERGIWQRRFWEHLIRDENDYAAHVDYIHYNPVKHGYVKAAAQWPHSSFHAYRRRGVYGLDWAGTDEGEKRFGERE
jgi:putative transposase